jgi:hypothetical protein
MPKCPRAERKLTDERDRLPVAVVARVGHDQHAPLPEPPALLGRDDDRLPAFQLEPVHVALEGAPVAVRLAARLDPAPLRVSHAAHHRYEALIMPVST